MNPYLLNERIIIKVPATNTINADGDSIKTYTTYNLWAYVKYESGNRNLVGDIVEQSKVYTFTIRPLPQLTNDSELTYRTEKYKIEWLDKPNKTFQHIRCSKVEA